MNELPNGYRLQSPKRTYTVLKKLGQGGFGITYLVKTNLQVGNITIPNVKFAIKEYFHKNSCMRDPVSQLVSSTEGAYDEVENEKEDVRHEARILQAVCQSTPYIVDVDEVFDANNTVYYVMQYLEGGSLVKLQGGKPLLEHQALSIIQEIATAAHVIHQQHLLHLDIKPDNIVFDNSNGGMTPVLIDFGMTKHYNEKGDATSRSITNGFTDGYSPVEQYGGINTFEPTADVYALGATLFYMLTGHTPAKAFDLRRSLIEAKIPIEISQSTREALLHALSFSKNERTATPKEFLIELGLDLKMGKSESPIIPQKIEDRNKTKKVTKKKKERKPKKNWLKNNWKVIIFSLIVILTIVGAIKTFVTVKTNIETKRIAEQKASLESKIEQLSSKIIVIEEHYLDNIDSLAAAQRYESELRTIDSTYQPNTVLAKAVDKKFNQLVADGDASSIPTVKYNCYEAALTLKQSPEVEQKLKNLGLTNKTKSPQSSSNEKNTFEKKKNKTTHNKQYHKGEKPETTVNPYNNLPDGKDGNSMNERHEKTPTSGVPTNKKPKPHQI